jgi:hypothetical protein
VEVVVLRVAHHANDLQRARLPFERELPAERITGTKVVARHRLVDDGHQRAAGIRRLEVAAGDQRRGKRLEVPRCHAIDGDAAAIVRMLHEAFHIDEQTAGDARHGCHPGGRCRVDARYRRHSFPQLPVQWRELFRRAPALGAIEPHLQDRLRVEADADRPQIRQMPDEQRRRGEHHHGQRHLRDDQPFAEEPPCASLRGAADLTQR